MNAPDRRAAGRIGLGLSNNGTFSGAIGEGAGLSSGGGLTLGAIVNSFGVLTKTFNIGSLDIDATLDVLERRGLAKTLAEPTLVALSGERASFLAGGEFPIPVAQSRAHPAADPARSPWSSSRLASASASPPPCWATTSSA